MTLSLKKKKKRLVLWKDWENWEGCRIFLANIGVICTFSGGSDCKESSCNVGDLDSISGLGRSSREGNGYPLQYCGLENPMDRGA